MALARSAGQRVVVVTATNGELGTNDPVAWPPGRLGALRRHELAASLAALGVTEHHLLGYADGGCAAVAPDRPVRQLVELIRAIQPDTIVTFGPDGITGHPDHQTVSAWTTAAWEASGRMGRLWYSATTTRHRDEWGALNNSLGVWMGDGEPVYADPADVVFEVDCTTALPDEALLDRKLVALRAHASQTNPLIEMLGLHVYRRWHEIESFVSAVPAEPAREPADREAAAVAGRDEHRSGAGTDVLTLPRQPSQVAVPSASEGLPAEPTRLGLAA
ncbi:MAG: PIG-L family deacetylase [Frankia sp.]|nr:PIG-L family deacetylase [Frankia sp.]